MPSFNFLGGPFMTWALQAPCLEGDPDGQTIPSPGQGGGVGRPRFPFRAPELSTAKFTISGTTRDSTGAALANCHVELYSDKSDAFIKDTNSDGAGNFSFTVPGNSDSYFVVAFGPTNTVCGATVQGLLATPG